MDFAAQLAKLERQAVNAVVQKNSNNNNSETNNSSSTGNSNTTTTTTITTSGVDRHHPRDRTPPYQRGGNGDNEDDRYSQHQRRRYNNNNNDNDRGRYHDRNHHSYTGGRRRSSPQQQQQSYNHHHYNNNNKLYQLQQSGYRIRSSLPWVPKINRTQPHICLLAIIIDELPYEHIWKEWAASHSSSNNCTVSLVCHAKYPKRVTSSWLQQRLLVQPPQLGRGGSSGRGNSSNNPTTATTTSTSMVYADPMYHTHVPEWGSIHIARAMIDCLKDGILIGTQKAHDIKDIRYTPNRYVISQPHPEDNNNNSAGTRSIPTVDKFIFISESCLPVRTLNEYVQLLFPPPPPPLEVTTTHDNGDVVVVASDTTFTEPRNNNNTNSEGEAKSNTSANADSEANIVDKNVEEMNDASLDDKNEASKGITDDLESKPLADIGGANVTNNVLPSKAEEQHDDKKVHTTSNSIDPWDISWVNGRSRNSVGTPRNLYENNQYQFIDYRIPDECRYKADQWILLSRRHAIHILHIDEHIVHPQYQFWTLFQKISASDEMYFPTALGVLGLLKDDDNVTSDDQNYSSADGVATSNNDKSADQPSSPVVWKRSVTYTDWSNGMRNPTSFAKGVRDFETVAKLAREQQCLLARKFIVAIPSSMLKTTATVKPTTGQITVEEWRNVMHTLSGNSNNSEGN